MTKKISLATVSTVDSRERQQQNWDDKSGVSYCHSGELMMPYTWGERIKDVSYGFSNT